jgi:O-methyltransferase domain
MCTYTASNHYLVQNRKAKGEEAKFDRHGNMLVAAKLNDYLEKNDYKNPDDAYDTPFQFAYQTKDNYFEWLKKNPEDLQAFNRTMTVNRQTAGNHWFEYFPVVEKLQASPERVLLIDIGGGIGHDISQFKKYFPNLPGKLVVQDLPDVIDDISVPLPDGVEAVKYDMFTPQPIVGAKAYSLRTVLHDWPDRQALKALAHVHEAMAEDSILLLIENIFPDSNVTSTSASLDLTMMTMFSSLERTESQWTSLLERGGFKLVRIWRPEQYTFGRNSVLEAVRI